ncbi:Transcriptional regulator of acetoin/glycerol metabolism [Desulfuromusa kysingii]|uniref:Transcriptional regulator of acetoin/glycerol metabolism n=1 Tax=Desulfuromusa kysingii TaxID=37625 RepID=A0A1H3YVD3_9BACT|nr:sigma-54-dependent Fis family transcriptional regulator [Desulfuromusa kysingii]SEA15523.1 Transcriptional regulator of acetoin/glycerol metabolism [Desulfuromusa kysingii]
MPLTDDNIDDKAKIWREFIVSGRIPDNTLRPEIYSSWQRCREANIDPYDGVSHELLTEEEIGELLQARKTQIDIIRHFMGNLYDLVKGSGFILFFADERGYIMEILGDPDTLSDAEKVNLIRGACWIEEAAGTNGIGTALTLGKPFQVSGQEHFCQKLHSWTCSAAPFFSETGDLIGVLQMSGPSHTAHQHTLGMVAASAEAIHEQMRVQHRNRELSVLNGQLNNIFQTISDGAIIVNKQRKITQINPSAKKLFGDNIIGSTVEDLLGKDTNISKIVREGKACKEMEVMLDTSFGRLHALVTVKQFLDQTGAFGEEVIFFNPINKMKKLANHLGGARATFTFDSLIGQSDKLNRTVNAAKQAALSNSHVVIQGESGTGKELLAQAIHNLSSRKNGPFLALNCAALPRDLIASELFGYVPGAFTGASSKGRPGRFEMASGGTLFLDEIGDMPLDQQASLLRVIQEMKIIRVGGEQVIPVDARIICATNKNLLREVDKGNFRQDLYYRLNVIQVHVPPLREREDDIRILFTHFLDKIGGKLNCKIQKVEADVLNKLQNYNWPGNVRELENVVEKMINAANCKIITTDHLPVEITSPQPEKIFQTSHLHMEKNRGKTLKQRVAVNERRIILELLQQYQGNISQIARIMEVSRNTLYRKINQYGISKDYRFD